MSDNKTWVKAYKGFDKDLKCRGRQYTEGVEDHVSDVARLCKEGVHACERPLDVLNITILRILCTMKLSLQAFWTSTKKIAKSAVQTSK